MEIKELLEQFNFTSNSSYCLDEADCAGVDDGDSMPSFVLTGRGIPWGWAALAAKAISRKQWKMMVTNTLAVLVIVLMILIYNSTFLLYFHENIERLGG